MPNWWDESPDERYWCEVTDRVDVGADLKAPQQNEAGRDYWSYSLIRSVSPGDVVFHYSTRERAFIGASVAGGPMEERPIVWTPHGTFGRAREAERVERPGYWRPLYAYRPASPPLQLKAIEEPDESAWLRSWVTAHAEREPLRLPFQLRNDGLRAGQGYLFKMPADFVEQWTVLRDLADSLDARAEEISNDFSVDPQFLSNAEAMFVPKNEADYSAKISATIQRRTRTHEKLVRLAGEWLQSRGAVVANSHPKDLEIISPVSVIIEAKVVRQRDPLFAVREALGQLHEYQYFIGPASASLAVLLDVEPPQVLTRYLEEHLGVALLWLTDGGLNGGPLANKLFLDRLQAQH